MFFQEQMHNVFMLLLIQPGHLKKDIHLAFISLRSRTLLTLKCAVGPSGR